MLPTVAVIKNHIDNIISWMQPFLPIANSHMVEYFTRSMFQQSLPVDLYNEILNSDVRNSLEFIFGNKSNFELPTLDSYIQGCKKMHLCNLKDVCLSRTDFNTKLADWGSGDTSSLKLEVFVTPKKSHEIEIVGQIAAALNFIKKTTHVIDVGGGKGYLGSLLALHHNIPVLSVDASQINTHGAIKRLRLLERAWNALQHNPKHSVPLDKKSPKNAKCYKQITEFVTEDTDFEKLVDDAFLEKSSSFGLVGLHTCGDLGSTCVKNFNKNKNIKTLCNVSCCYHLLSEEFEDTYSKDNKNFGFPLSTFLKSKQFQLGRTARMLAAQSIDRILHKRELPNETVLYRAILEILLDRYDINSNNRRVGKLKKQCKNFVEYTYISLNKIKANIEISSSEIEDLFETYKIYKEQLHVFYMLRCMLAPVVESLILLDRLLFLHENGCQSAFLVHLFDTVISPRCYGLIAFKDM